MLALTFLVGYGFIQAVDLYSQASRSAIEFPELARGMVPFEGILVPTLGAFYLASTLLLPFVAIRAIAQDKESGALKLLLQMPIAPAWLVALKVIAILLTVTALLVPSLSFVPIWLYLGGHIHLPELLNLLAGHALYALDVASIAFLAAALSESLSTAAILALVFTLAFWVMDFAATASEGFLHRLSFYSLTAALRQFEQGLFNLPAALAMMLGAVGLFALTATWLPTGTAAREKLQVSFLIVLLFSVLAIASSYARVYVDFTENRRNSFRPTRLPCAECKAPCLFGFTSRLRTAGLKKWKLMSSESFAAQFLILRSATRTHAGMVFSAPCPMSATASSFTNIMGKRAESRSNSPREILPLLHELSGTKVKPEKEPDYRGYPLVADATGYAAWFYGILPAFMLFSWWRVRQ